MSMVIRINDLLVDAIIGVYEDERTAPQPISIHVEMEYDATAAVAGDNYAAAVDYESLAQSITEQVKTSRYNLVETLADHILRLLLADERVQQAAVTVEKPSAIENAESVSVTTLGRATRPGE
jgi:dihydroneopterin aldolase